MRFILAQFWRPEVQILGVHRATLPLDSLGDNPSQTPPASGGSRHSSARGCIYLISASVGSLLPVSVSNLPLPCPYKDTWHRVETHPQVIQDDVISRVLS